MKISTGTAAIVMARNEEWEPLKEYCEMDVTILNNLFRRRHLLNPRNNAMMDLSFIAIDRLYSDSPRPGAEHSTLEKYMRLTGDSDRIIPRDKPMEVCDPFPVPRVPATTRDYQRMSLLE